MNKFRKFLIGILIAASATCVCGAVACNNDSGQPAATYYELNLDGRGFDIKFEGDLAELDDKGNEFVFRGKVKEGVEVRFKVIVGANMVGNPSVSVNGTPLQPDGEGSYSFIMSEDSRISVGGLNAVYKMKMPRIKVTEDENGQKTYEDRRIKFYDATGKNEITDREISVEGGDDFTFALWTSPYYTDEYTVKCGYEVLESTGTVKGPFGSDLKLYTISGVASNGEIDVIGLTEDAAFATFDDTAKYGDGTEANPYKIRKAIDLYTLAALVNDPNYNSRYSPCYYRMEADINLYGEELFMIGNYSTENSAFNGHFDGNGHTISNFHITDEAIDPDNVDENTGMYKTGYLPYVGMFGYAAASIDRNYNILPVTIKNLTLDNFSVAAHPANAEAASTAGSLLGFGVGVQITGCNVTNGDLFVEDDDNQMVLMGGIVGRLQGAYGNTAGGIVTANSFVRSCSVDMDVSGTGSPRAAGGIVGYLISSDENAVAYVMNSYSKGSVSGAMHSGGIVGTLGRFSSVVGCYSDAFVSANNRLDGANVSDDFMHAYAGGIAGYAEESTVVYGCYAANYTNSSVNKLYAENVNGDRYTGIGAYAGGRETPHAKAADLKEFIAYNNLTAQSQLNKDVFTAIGWSDDDWTFDDEKLAKGELPEIKISPARAITVKLQGKGNEVITNNFAATDTMNNLYANGLDEYIQGSGASRSWGYYFDPDLRYKVPFGFVPLRAETTLYYDYADYSAVIGSYYFGSTTYSNSAYITLNADGTALLRNGGMHHECKYAYDGENIIIYRSAIASLTYSAAQLQAGYFAYGGKLSGDGVLTLESYVTLANLSYDETNPSSGSQFVYEEATLSALKGIEFAYGEYKDEDGVVYVLNKNGTGTRTTTSGTTSFTFNPSLSGFELVPGGNNPNVAVTVAGGKATQIGGKTVQLKDGFKGSWQTDANAFTVFTFDGIDSVTMTVAGETPKTATYETKADNSISFTFGTGAEEKTYKATINGGNVVIEGVTYYVSDGFTGKWFMVSEDEWIEFSLGGVGAEGYGYATIDYSGGASRSLEAQYDVLTVGGVNYLRIYVGDEQYGQLACNAATKSASGDFYSNVRQDFSQLTFYLYDALRGVWTGVSDSFDSVTFNGRSASSAESEAVLTSADGKTVLRGVYTINGNTGTMTVNKVNYTLTYDEKTNKITVSASGEGGADEQLARRDGWYKVKLYDGATEYEFDGKSNLSGHVKVTNGTTTVTLPYTIEGDTVKIDGVALTPTADGFRLNGNTLKFRTGFAGEWIVSGTDELLTVKEVNGNLSAEVTYGGNSENFVYSIADGTLTCTEGDTVTVIRVLSNDQISITRRNAQESNNYYCLKPDLADKYKGTYTGSDGSWLLDGMGECRYGTGTAVFTPATGEAVKYSYKINTLGIPYLSGDKNLLFMPAGDGEDGYVKDTQAYKTTEVDAYYDRTAYDYNAETRTTYYFDGASTVYLKEGNSFTPVYKYEIVSGARCEFIDPVTGERKNVQMQQPGANINITISKQTTVDYGEGANKVTYAIGVATLWKVTVDGANYSYEKAYTLAATNTDNQYVLTDAAGIRYNAEYTPKQGEEPASFKITVAISLTATADGVTYAFGDGYDTVWKVENGEYTRAYTYVLKDAANSIYELTAVDGGAKFTAQLTRNGNNYTMVITSAETEQA